MKLRSSGREAEKIEPQMAPMIDVVFQLIIFFMFTSQFGELRRTEVDLPKQPGDEAKVQREAALIVDLMIDGRYFVDSKEMDIEDVASLARSGVSLSGDGEIFDVLVRPDRHAPAVYLDRLLIRLSESGVVDWKLATVGGEGSS